MAAELPDEAAGRAPGRGRLNGRRVLVVGAGTRATADPDAPGWAPFDRTLLTAADELADDACITDETWAALAERYDERQLIEVPMLVGQYHMVAFTLNSLGVQREPGVPGLPDERG